MGPSPNVSTDIFLTDISPIDKPWDKHKDENSQVLEMYAQELKYRKLAERMRVCSGWLGFAWITNKETGEAKFKLVKTQFCRARHCPICQWRRALLWRAKLYQVIPSLRAQHPTAKFIYAVFTIRNCAVADLRETLGEMNKAWKRLLKRKEFSGIHLGWIRTTEITRGKDGSAHPHFNLLLMVKPGYFKGSAYLSKDSWIKLWRECARLDYDPSVFVELAKNRKKTKKGNLDEVGTAAMEVLKYSVKPSDMLADKDWFLELHEQVHHLRFIAAGGLFKDFLKTEEEITEEEMTSLGETEEDNEAAEEIISFLWNNSHRRYIQHKLPLDNHYTRLVQASQRRERVFELTQEDKARRV